MAQIKGLDNPVVLESAAQIWTTTGDTEKIPIWLDCDTGKLKYQPWSSIENLISPNGSSNYYCK
jgi:hypothetical protein